MARFCRFWLGSRLVDELEGFRKNKLYVDAVGIRAHFRETVFILGSKVRELRWNLKIIISY
jgi:hypothetical protein